MKYREGSEYAIVKIKVDDIERIRLMKLPQNVRDYFKQRQKEYRQRLKKKE